MGMLDWTVTPIVISALVGCIGVFGLVAALIATNGIGRERSRLKHGREVLRDLPLGQPPSFDYREWINEHRGLADSHFTDHILATSGAAQSGRAVTLHELHEVSARREARRLSASMSGGVTTLLLVCGIAGTLWCIKPVLSGFDIRANPAGEFEAAESAQTATKLIQDLSGAFLPSLVALVLTILVTFVRGFYTHTRGALAGELDRFALEDLFPRFPPPSVSRELDEVRSQLAELVTQMVASQRNFDHFVDRLSGAARNFRAQAPPLQDASKRFVDAADILSPKLDELRTTLSGSLGATSPLCTQLGSLDTLSKQVTATVQEMHLAGTVLTKHLHESHLLLREIAADLPAQIAAGCETASKIIGEATANTINAACTEAIRTLDTAAAPLRQAAEEVNAANQALRDDITRSLQSSVQGLRKHGDTMEQDFRQALEAAVAMITMMQDSATGAINKAGFTVDRLEQLQKKIMNSLGETAMARQKIAQFRTDMQSATAQIGAYSHKLQDATTELHDAHKAGRTLINGLASMAPNIDRLTKGSNDLLTAFEGLKASQETTTQRIDELLRRTEQAAENWQTILAETTQRSEAGAILNAESARLLAKGEEVATQLKDGAAEAALQQQRLADDLAVLSDALTHLEHKKDSSWVDRVFRGKR